MATKGALPKTLQRISSSPGLPTPNPTPANWQLPPNPLSKTQSPTLPNSTDILIIGTGITGCSVAQELLFLFPDIKVTVLEARTLTSGATGRNGGHVSCHPVIDYGCLVDALGKEEACRICRFRLGHFEEMRGVLKNIGEEAVERSEIRGVEAVCGLVGEEIVGRMRERREKLEGDWPEFKGRVSIYEKGDPEFEKFKMSGVDGLTVEKSGAIWPYRMITSIFSHLLTKYPTRFTIETLTPATGITCLPTSSSEKGPYKYKYAIQTPRGTIITTQIAHCTNAHTSHLLPPLRGKIFPVRGQMSVQRPGHLFPNLGNERSWSVIWGPGEGLDYITQNGKTGELFYGGGLVRGMEGGLESLGNGDDEGEDLWTRIHLSGALGVWFGGENWGSDCGKGRVKGSWSGVMGFTGDGLPLVGKLTEGLTGRKGEGEYIAAGFNGYGMVNSWGCGKALARLMLGMKVGEGFPRSYLVSEERVGRMKGEDMVRALVGKIV